MAGATSRVRVGLDVDRAADPTTWTLTDLTSRHQDDDGAIRIRRGRSGNSQEPQPGNSTFRLNNGDGALSPRYPGSPYYPDLDLGVPVVIDVLAGFPNLLTFDESGGASTPDHASLDIVGDIAVAVEYESPYRFPATLGMDGITKWRTTSNQRSWRTTVDSNGFFSFEWSNNGTATLFFTTQLQVPRYDAGPAVYGCWLDVDNGAAGRTITFYVGRGTIADLLANPTRFIFETQTASGTTSIFASTAPVEVGVNPETATSAGYKGRIRKAVVVEGSFAGTVRASPDFTAQTVGATSFSDAQGRTWTLGANSDIDGYSTRIVGDLAAAGPAWPGHGVAGAAEVEWEVAGPLRRMRQRSEPLQSALYRHITAPIQTSFVKAYWPLEDGAEALTASSPIAGVSPMAIQDPGGQVRFASDSTLVASKPLVHVNGQIGYNGAVPRYTGTQSRTDIFFRIDTANASPNGTFIGAIYTTGTVAQWQWAIDTTAVYIIGLSLTGGSLVSTSFPFDARMVGTWCLLSFEISQSGGNIAWDIKVVPIPLGLAFGTNNTVAGTVGIVTAVHNWNNPTPSSGGMSIGHIVVSTGTSLGWLAPADTAFTGEPAARRFWRLCKEQGVTAMVDGVYGSTWATALSRGAKPMGPQRPLPLLDLLSECAVVERAEFCEARELPGLVYRANRYNQDPVITFTGELGNPLAPTQDDQSTVNDLTVSRNSAESYRLVNQASKDKAGEFPHNQPVNTATALELPDFASWLMGEVLTDEMRIPALKVDLGKTPGLFDEWLAARFGDIVKSTGLPPWFSEPELRQVLTGYAETISRNHWELEINGTPAGVWDIGIRDSSTLGIRDTGGSVVNTDFIAGTHTTLSVATTLGPLWAVTAASNSALPFDLDVGGYRVTCSAIGAAAGAVQAFTVSTTVWPAQTKTIPAGTAVRLWRPARRALLRSP